MFQNKRGRGYIYDICDWDDSWVFVGNGYLCTSMFTGDWESEECLIKKRSLLSGLIGGITAGTYSGGR